MHEKTIWKLEIDEIAQNGGQQKCLDKAFQDPLKRGVKS